MTLTELTLRAADLASIVAHVDSALPNEGCGLLAGPPGNAERVYLLDNIRHSPVAYEVEPAELVRILLELEAVGWEVCGIFHSHPAGPPVPSPTDIAQAGYPEAVYVILAPAAGQRWNARGFLIDEGRVEEVPIRVVE